MTEPWYPYPPVPEWVYRADTPPPADPDPVWYSVNPVNDRKVWLAAGAVYLVLVAVLLTLTWRREA